MTFDQLVSAIFDDYENKHRDILGDVMATCRQQAERIVSKYDTTELSQEEIDRLKDMIVKKEVSTFLQFVEQNKDILDGDFSDRQKFRLLFERHDKPSLSEQERTLLQKRIRRHIYDNEVCKILQDLVDDLKQ